MLSSAIPCFFARRPPVKKNYDFLGVSLDSASYHALSDTIADKPYNTVDDLTLLFSELNALTVDSDALKLAIESCKLAIIKKVFYPFQPMPASEIVPPSGWKYIFYYLGLLGGSWIAYLNAYDATEALVELLPFSMPFGIEFGIISALTSIGLAMLAAFEAVGLKKHMNFVSTQALKEVFDIKQQQFKLTIKLSRYIAMHAADFDSAKEYAAYTTLIRMLDKSMIATTNEVKSYEPSSWMKIAAKIAIVLGTASAGLDQIYLVVGFGVLALAPYWAALIIAATVIVGAILFYVAYRQMIYHKIAPVLGQKEKILRLSEDYKSDNALSMIEKNCIEKQYKADVGEIIVLQQKIMQDLKTCSQEEKEIKNMQKTLRQLQEDYESREKKLAQNHLTLKYQEAFKTLKLTIETAEQLLLEKKTLWQQVNEKIIPSTPSPPIRQPSRPPSPLVLGGLKIFDPPTTIVFSSDNDEKENHKEDGEENNRDTMETGAFQFK